MVVKVEQIMIHNRKCHLKKGDIIIVRGLRKGSAWEIEDRKPPRRIIGYRFRVIKVDEYYCNGCVRAELEPLETVFYVPTLYVSLTSFKKVR